MINNKLKGKLLKVEGGVALTTYVWVTDFAEENAITISEVVRTAVETLKKKVERGGNYKQIKRELSDD